MTADPKSVARAMGVASLRRSTIANASQLPLPRLSGKRYCAPVSGAISSTTPLPFILDLRLFRVENRLGVSMAFPRFLILGLHIGHIHLQSGQPFHMHPSGCQLLTMMYGAQSTSKQIHAQQKFLDDLSYCSTNNPSTNLNYRTIF